MVGDMGKLVFVCGTSAAGKTALVGDVLAMLPSTGRVLTSTSRAPRQGETDGVHYNFYANDDFRRRISEGEFLEHAEVHGNLYGTRKADLERALAKHSIVLHIIDIQGIRSLQAVYPDALVVCISATLEDVIERLKFNKMGEEEIGRRIKTALWELEEISQMKIDKIILNKNGEKDKAIKELCAYLTKVTGINCP
jgi:guanylate kinase